MSGRIVFRKTVSDDRLHELRARSGYFGHGIQSLYGLLNSNATSTAKPNPRFADIEKLCGAINNREHAIQANLVAADEGDFCSPNVTVEVQFWTRRSKTRPKVERFVGTPEAIEMRLLGFLAALDMISAGA